MIATTAALWGWGAIWHLISYISLSSSGFADFGRFYYAARLWRDGASLYGPSASTWLQLETGQGMHLWNLNPPHVSLLFLPLTWVGVEQAYAIWLGITFFCLVFAAQMIVDALRCRPTRLELALGAAFVFASTPTLAYSGTGNLTGPLALLMTWTWREWRLGRGRRAAIGIGIAWSAKLFLLPLVLYLVTKRQWRAAAVSIATGAGLFAIGLAVFGWAEQVSWTRRDRRHSMALAGAELLDRGAIHARRVRSGGWLD